LPANLPNAIKQLDDHEFGRLLSAVLDEQNWRGKKLPSAEPKQRLELAPNSLTRGQINAVRAAFKAGITPSQIARQFGLSQSDVRKSLASQDERNGEPVTLRAHLADLERQHKAIEGEIADALAHSSTDDLKIAELKRRKANTER